MAVAEHSRRWRDKVIRDVDALQHPLCLQELRHRVHDVVDIDELIRLAQEASEVRVDEQILEVYREAMKAMQAPKTADSERTLIQARKKALRIYRENPPQAPVDGLRLASILESSDDPQELAIAQRLHIVLVLPAAEGA